MTLISPKTSPPPLRCIPWFAAASDYRNATYSTMVTSVANEAKAINPVLARVTGVETIKAGTNAMLV